MRASQRLLLLLLPTALVACDIDRASAPPAVPTRPALAADACELGVSDALARAQIDALIEDVTELETNGTLTAGQANALRGHLANVLRQIDAGRYCPALAQLNAFSDQVSSFEAEGILTTDEADQLELGATQVITGPPNLVTVNPPSAAAGTYAAGYATFGPEPTIAGVTAPIVLVNDGTVSPALGCSPLVGFPAGAIALVQRGTCTFIVKAMNAQAAGAIAVIVHDNRVVDLPTNMAGSGNIVIPTVSVTQAVGLMIRAGLPATGTVSRKP